MNDTTVLAVQRDEDVRAYVAAVRAWLADLPTDEVEDLTAGMEADLAERAAESGGTLGGLLGQPEAYAAELRSAAGLPPRSVVLLPDTGAREPLTARLGREAHELVAGHPWLRELRPTWWLARGAVAGWVLASVMGTGRTIVLPLVGAALSMWLGLVLRRREPLGSGSRVALGAGNALAVVLLLPMLGFYTAGSGGDAEVAGNGMPPAGLSVDGSQVSNVYAYDATGHRIDDVRLFDQYGQPLQLSLGADPVPTGPDGQELVAWPPSQGALSVFPLRLVPGADPWSTANGEWSPPVTVGPLAGSVPSSPTSSPTTSPAAPGPTSSASASGGSGSGAATIAPSATP